MPQTLLQVANSALIKIGASPISGLTQGVKPAELANARIRPVRDMLLRGHVWNFARGKASLTAVASDIDKWGWYYVIPTNVLRILSLFDGEDGLRIDDYEIMSGRIYTDAVVLFLRYIDLPATSDEANETYPDDFAEAWASYLAAELSTALYDSPDRRQQWMQQYESLMRSARFNGAVEQPLRVIEASAWLDSRHTYLETDRSQYGLDAPSGGV